MIKQLLQFGIIIMIILVVPVYSDSNEFSLSFKEIGQWVSAHSPEYRLMMSRSDKQFSEAGLDLQASNPAFSYSRESVANDGLTELEQVFALSKTLEMPWIYSKRRKSFRLLKEALTLEREQKRREFTARMKTGYVTLAFMRQRMAQFRELEIILMTLAGITGSRENEGFLAPYEKQLFDIAFQGLQGRMLRFELNLEKEEGLWKQAMGIAPGKKVRLITKINFLPITLNKSENVHQLLQRTPGYKMWQSLEQRIETEKNVESLRFLPDFTISGGYKQVSDHFKGYTLGLSFELPIFNRNKRGVETQRLALDIHRKEFQWYRDERVRKIKETLSAVHRYQQLLQQSGDSAANPTTNIQPVISAFKEGTISMADLLNAIQVHMDGMENYYLLLNDLYTTIFQLETMTGIDLVTF
jgi:outer membrane protein TolC